MESINSNMGDESVDKPSGLELTKICAKEKHL